VFIKNMTRQRKIVLVKAAMVMVALPVLLWAYEYGPDPGYCGVPNENGGASGATCATAGCHTGTANDPNNKGSVSVSFPNGMTYTPGVAQTLSVTVTDPAEKAAGFELTARQSSSPSTMAGTFAANDANTQVVCALPSNLGIFASAATSAACQTGRNSGYSLHYIEHSRAGFTNSVGHLPYTFTFTWTPPATDVGNVTIYIAGNAGVGLPANQNGDHVYSTKYTLTPGSGGGGSAPAITSGGIVSASAFGGFSAATAGSWIEIYGTNLGPSTPYTWAGSDFTGNNAPTKLQGVTLTVNGINAFIDYVSATQVNAQVPGGVGTGPATVILNNSNGSSAPYTLTLNTLEPGLLAPSAFTVGGKLYVVAFNSDGSYTLPTTSTLGLNSRPAKPGETLVIYGVGFGPAQPPGGAVISPGVIVTAANTLTNPMQMAFNGTSVTPSYYGLAPNYVGLYQFNVTVPTSLANSDAVPLTFNVGGNTGNQTLYTAVHN
jgi:uncharacterized protein (TIGR03437 family)